MPLTCRECGSEELITDYAAGDVICHDCGLVIEGNCIDNSPEWRIFQNDGGGGNQTNPRAEKMSSTGGQITSFVGGTAAMYRAHRQVSNTDKNELLAKAFNRIGPMVHQLGLPETVLEKSKEILAYLTEDMVPDKIMSADGSRTIWARSGKNSGALIKGQWGNELFAHMLQENISSLLLCYLSEDAAKRAKLAFCDQKDFAGVVKDTGDIGCSPEIVEHAEGEEAPWRLTVTLDNQLKEGKHGGQLTWDVILKLLNRKWENGEAQMCAVINLAYREEADASAGLEFRKFETVFQSVTTKDVSKYFKRFQRQRTISVPTRALDPKDLLPRMCAKLKVTIECERKAFEVLDVVSKSGDFSGKKPSTQAAAAILYAANHLTTAPVRPGRSLDVREIAKLAGVKDKTVTDTYDKMRTGRSGSRLHHKFGA
jgi:transcription initiation factor TFIIIB Brf1 subunit/transcription initiation factor TFIIB